MQAQIQSLDDATLWITFAKGSRAVLSLTDQRKRLTLSE